mmetsp:Transcript_17990/g.18211  ORF Transcript_17990/g.18211 Transcript_17990/m.18211 type:complete len:140 (-) Transcript_17990:513-932(-)
MRATASTIIVALFVSISMCLAQQNSLRHGPLRDALKIDREGQIESSNSKNARGLEDEKAPNWDELPQKTGFWRRRKRRQDRKDERGEEEEEEPAPSDEGEEEPAPIDEGDEEEEEPVPVPVPSDEGGDSNTAGENEDGR